jgi:hypothetical protein
MEKLCVTYPTTSSSDDADLPASYRRQSRIRKVCRGFPDMNAGGPHTAQNDRADETAFFPPRELEELAPSPP